MAILAHRGLTAAGRGNSFLAIKSVAGAAGKGIPIGIELDVRASDDGHLVSHEPVDQSTVIATLDFSGSTPFDHLTLRESLQWVTDLAVVNLELKDAGLAAVVTDEVRRHCRITGQSPDCFVLSSFLPATVRELSQVASEFTVGCLIDCYFPIYEGYPGVVVRRLGSADMSVDPMTAWLLQIFDWTGADTLHAHWSHACPALFRELEARGKRASFWTVDHALLLTELALHPGVDHVITNHPEYIYRQLDEMHPRVPRHSPVRVNS